VANIAQPRAALAWGDDEHKVVALIAQSFLEKDVRKQVNFLLAAGSAG
jgi:tRNA U38,U39,U40 pseudouridine synthase TruA